MAEGQAQPSAPSMTKMAPMLIGLMVVMVLMFFYQQIGAVLNFVFWPLALNGSMIVVTLILMGVIMITLSTVIRSLMTNYVKQQEQQHVMRAFNAELRQARIENNLFKLKKLQEQQQNMMSSSMNQSMGMMKVMPITMAIVIPIYSWVYFFIYTTCVGGDISTLIHLPWGGTIDIAMRLWNFFPAYIIVYTLITIPFGQVIARLIRYYQFRKRLTEIEKKEQQEQVEAV